MTCLNHVSVPTRRLHFKMVEDHDSRMTPGHIIRAEDGALDDHQLDSLTPQEEAAIENLRDRLAAL